MNPNDKIQILLAASRNMNTIQKLSDLIKIALEMALDFTGAERCFMVFELPDGALVIATKNGDWYKPNEIKISTSLVMQMLINGTPALWTVNEQGNELSPTDSILELNLKTVMCSPIKSRWQLLGTINDFKQMRFDSQKIDVYSPIGALYVDISTNTHKFTYDDLHFFEMFVQHTALALENVLLWEKLRKENDSLRSRVEAKYHYHNIIGESPQIKEVYKVLELVKDTDVEVLIMGETGTGKELVAKTLHFNGKRRDKVFAQVNCAALPESIVEAELFGIEKAVATGVTARKGKFEEANQGTLFLDEIADMSLLVQIKILRFLQEHHFRRVGGKVEQHSDVRVIAATNKLLDKEIQSGRFREDLYYRLNTIVIYLPPLRERGEDVLLIAYTYLKTVCAKYKLDIRGFSADAETEMLKYHWPGNVRELIHIIQRAAVLANGPVIKAEDLKLDEKPKVTVPKGTFRDMRDEFEKNLIMQEMAMQNSNISSTARNLGITRKTLYEKMEELKIEF